MAAVGQARSERVGCDSTFQAALPDCGNGGWI